MNGDQGKLFPNNYTPFRDKKYSGRKLKKRFLVKMKRKFHVLHDWSKSVKSFGNPEQSKLKSLELKKFSQGFDQFEECIFFYVNGVIQMANISKSAN